MLRTLIVLCSLGFTPAFAANQVHTVGLAGTADFADVQTAVNAAGDGDIVFVKSGQYTPVTIDGKSVTIIGIANPNHPTVSGFTIRNIGAAQRVVVRGIDVPSLVLAVGNLVFVDQCAGAVTFEDSWVAGLFVVGDAFAGEKALVRVQASPRVVFSRCTFAPPQAGYGTGVSPLPAPPALRVVASDVACYDSILNGPAGQDAAPPFGPFPIELSSPGSAAIDMQSGSLLLAGCTVTGGRGGNGSIALAQCLAPSAGGPGLVCGGGSVRLLDTTIAGGAGGIPNGQCPGSAPAGPPTIVTGGSISTINETLRRFEVSSPAFEGNVESTVFHGVPGEHVLMLLSVGASNTYLPGLQSMLHPAIPFFVISLGFVPPSGEIAFTVALPSPLLPVGFEGVDLFEQCVVAGNSGFGLLSAPSVRTVFVAGM